MIPKINGVEMGCKRNSFFRIKLRVGLGLPRAVERESCDNDVAGAIFGAKLRFPQHCSEWLNKVFRFFSV